MHNKLISLTTPLYEALRFQCEQALARRDIGPAEIYVILSIHPSDEKKIEEAVVKLATMANGKPSMLDREKVRVMLRNPALDDTFIEKATEIIETLGKIFQEFADNPITEDEKDLLTPILARNLPKYYSVVGKKVKTENYFLGPLMIFSEKFLNTSRRGIPTKQLVVRLENGSFQKAFERWREFTRKKIPDEFVGYL